VSTQTGVRTGKRAEVTAEHAMPALSAGQLMELLQLIKGADSVELKLTVPDGYLRSAVTALGIDPLDAQIRQVAFFDTPTLELNQHGIVVRARRIQGKPGDSVVKLRPVDPERLDPAVRRSAAFGVEVDAMPGGFVCSGAMKAVLPDAKVKDSIEGRRSARRLFSKEQQALFASRAPAGLRLDDLVVLGPIHVLKLKFTPAAFERRLVAELWLYPDGSRILELSTKCPPADAFTAAAETKAFLASRGLDLAAPQQTKTRSALEFFARELAEAEKK
jgi:hypothetical protein